MKSDWNIDVDGKGTFKWPETLPGKGWKRRLLVQVGFIEFQAFSLVAQTDFIKSTSFKTSSESRVSTLIPKKVIKSVVNYTIVYTMQLKS